MHEPKLPYALHLCSGPAGVRAVESRDGQGGFPAVNRASAEIGLVRAGGEQPQHLLGAQVADRLIAPMVPEFQFHGLGAARQGEDLMAETNPHDRLDPQALLHLLNDRG